jgi:hypothetical protein
MCLVRVGFGDGCVVLLKVHNFVVLLKVHSFVVLLKVHSFFVSGLWTNHVSACREQSVDRLTHRHYLGERLN